MVAASAFILIDNEPAQREGWWRTHALVAFHLVGSNEHPLEVLVAHRWLQVSCHPPHQPAPVYCYPLYSPWRLFLVTRVPLPASKNGHVMYAPVQTSP